jgi:hypothetical protein
LTAAQGGFFQNANTSRARELQSLGAAADADDRRSTWEALEDPVSPSATTSLTELQCHHYARAENMPSFMNAQESGGGLILAYLTV